MVIRTWAEMTSTICCFGLQSRTSDRMAARALPMIPRACRDCGVRSLARKKSFRLLLKPRFLSTTRARNTSALLTGHYLNG